MTSNKTELSTSALEVMAKNKKKKSGGSFFSKRWPIVTTLLVVIGLLWFGSLFFPPYILPGPWAVAEGLVEVFQKYGMQILLTLGRYIFALVTAMIAGWVVGLLMGAFRNIFGRFMQPIVSVVQAIPSLSWILLVILWFSQVELRIWFVTFILAFPFFVIAVYEGIRDMDKDTLEAVEQFRPTKVQVITKLLIPQSFVNIITVLRSTAAMTLKIMIFSEMLGANNGIGQQMSLAQSAFRTDLILAWTAILVVTNFVILWLVKLLEKKLLAWRSEAVVR